jgi:hypothetical protein
VPGRRGPQEEPPEKHAAQVGEVRHAGPSGHPEEQFDDAEHDDEVLRLQAHRQHEEDKQRDHPLGEEQAVGHQQPEDDPRSAENQTLAAEIRSTRTTLNAAPTPLTAQKAANRPFQTLLTSGRTSKRERVERQVEDPPCEAS